LRVKGSLDRPQRFGEGCGRVIPGHVVTADCVMVGDGAAIGDKCL
jgi:hypothetical protein